MGINRKLGHQVGDQTKVILRYTVNEPSSFIVSTKSVFFLTFVLSQGPEGLDCSREPPLPPSLGCVPGAFLYVQEQ